MGVGIFPLQLTTCLFGLHIYEHFVLSRMRRSANVIMMVCNHVPASTWWRHEMETFSALLVICAGNSPVPVNSPHKGQWRGALMFSLICVWVNGWVNNREAGDLIRHRAHYGVIVMKQTMLDGSREVGNPSVSLLFTRYCWVIPKQYIWDGFDLDHIAKSYNLSIHV